jgi:predicted dehydrogenase
VSASPLRVGVVGVGAFGRHHARIYHDLGADVRLVGLVDTDPRGPREVAERLRVPLVRRVEDLPEPPDLVSVAVPTADHRRIAEPLLRAGIHCLVEKPLAGSSVDARALVAAARAGNAILQVGLVERFNPVRQALDRLGSPPSYLEVHRLAPHSPRGADVGVVMDLMIHDLDLIHALVGEEAEEVEAVGVAVVGPHEDVANARSTFPSGCVANVTASRVALARRRRFQVFSPEAWLSLDFDRREALLMRPQADLGDRDPRELLEPQKLPIQDAEPLREELAALVRAVRRRARPEVGGAEGLRALCLAERILEAIAGGRRAAEDLRPPLQVLKGQRITGS